MTTKPHGVIPHANQLPTLAASINDHLAAADAATRRGLEHAIAAGLLLIEAKELVPHGEWCRGCKRIADSASARRAHTCGLHAIVIGSNRR